MAGRKLGNKAMVWGAIAGTIPDLDVLLNPWLDTVQQLTFHRSLTHSLLFAVLVSPVLGWLLKRWYRAKPATLADWTLLFFLGFTTHALLDSCTTWGTQLFWPFSTYGVAFYNIFVVDPLYTVPFLGFSLAAAFHSRYNPKRRYLNYAGLAISTAYLFWSFVAKSIADEVFTDAMERQGIVYTSYISKPTPMNTLFWSVTAKDSLGFHNGFYSLLDKDEQVDYTYEQQHKELLTAYRGHPKLERLMELTKGYYTVEKAADKGILINDLRFGKFDNWRDGGGSYVFVYKVWQNPQGELEFEEINNRPKIDKAYLLAYWRRITGHK